MLLVALPLLRSSAWLKPFFAAADERGWVNGIAREPKKLQQQVLAKYLLMQAWLRGLQPCNGILALLQAEGRPRELKQVAQQAMRCKLRRAATGARCASPRKLARPHTAGWMSCRLFTIATSGATFG